MGVLFFLSSMERPAYRPADRILRAMLGLRQLSPPMQRLLAIVFALGIAVMVGASTNVAAVDIPRLAFWIVLALLATALPVRLPGGLSAHIATAPILASLFDPALPQPFSVVWTAFLGTFELRDLRRQIAWYGTLYNKFSVVIPAFAAWWAQTLFTQLGARDDPWIVFPLLLVVGATFMTLNSILAVVAASVRTGSPIRRTFTIVVQNISVGLVAQVPLGWLMAEIADKVGHWATLLFMIPLLLARFSFTKYTELRELFFGSVSALSQAIDAKDGFTRGHADRVSRIAGAIAREIGLSEREIEQIELAAMLHDIGKIGVEDRILMKPSRLDPEETLAMRRHSAYGASILSPSAALRPLVPLVLHHHESYDGSGYPEGLKGEDIPLGSRVIIVADAYEAMTSDRIYRKAMGHERAMEQLQKYKGIQFDPRMVRAIDQLLQKRGPAAFDVSDLPPIEYETLAELRRRLAQEGVSHNAHAD
jgi:HD-GYP domain-containing protein (c-di-GMP phosphodiesterase class II)